MLNTKSETIESNTGDPFWERCESMFLQAIIYYVIFNYDEKDRNFKTVLELIRLAEPDKDGNSTLGNMFKNGNQKIQQILVLSNGNILKYLLLLQNDEYNYYYSICKIITVQYC